MLVCQTDRLTIRHFGDQDAPFILTLLNDKSFIDNIADKGLKTIDDALNYLRAGPMASYEKFGFGLNLVCLRYSDIPIGMCGLVSRDELEHSDLGYALLPEYWRQGYAYEASLAVLKDGQDSYNLAVVAAITSPHNKASNGLLKKLGFSFVDLIELSGDTNNLYEYYSA